MTWHRRLFAGACVALLATATAAPALAGQIFFGEDFWTPGNPYPIPHPHSDQARDAFLAALISFGTESFEEYPSPTHTPLLIDFDGMATAVVTGDAIVRATTGFDRYPISGSNVLEAAFGEFTFTFGSPVAAFGFYGTDVGDVLDQPLVLTFFHVSGPAQTVTVPMSFDSGSRNASVLFFGLVDPLNPFTAVTFANGASDYNGFDDITMGVARVDPIFRDGFESGSRQP